jgi:UDP-N-acetylmuramoyl-tripeptide--D-alanyl-D-alanine ligase
VSSKFSNIKELYDKFVQFPFISTDTRKILPNSIFFCLKGENFDGNQFAEEALEKGARYVVKGDNVLETLQQLARYHRAQLTIPIIGITGTNGKTTTKELIAAVLSKKYKTAYTQGNLNNHIGVPLTLLSITKEDEIAVIEMGANHLGEIEELCQIAQPDYGLITNIGKAHLEGFGSIENIIETKTALYRAARVIFVNGEDEILMGKCRGKARLAPTVIYGKNTPISTTLLKMTPCLNINLFGKNIQTQLTGNYNLSNILGAAAIGRFFGVSENDICEAIAAYTPQNHRSQVIHSGSNTIIADYYNANPTSMRAALDNFLQIEAPHKVAILGDMLELGENSIPEHKVIIDFCEANHLETIFIGSIFHSLKNERFLFFKDVEECNHYLGSSTEVEPPPNGVLKGRGSIFQNSFILIKGSRGIKLENIVLV